MPGRLYNAREKAPHGGREGDDGMPLYERHVFVCTTGKDCPKRGSQEIRDSLKMLAREAGLAVRVNNCGCLGQCGRGPNIVVYPEGHWYQGVGPEDLPDILDSLRDGRPVERLLNPRHHPEASAPPESDDPS